MVSTEVKMLTGKDRNACILALAMGLGVGLGKATADCGSPTSGDCYVAHPGTSCNNFECCQSVCAIDFFCCASAWDSVCAGLAQTTCGPKVHNQTSGGQFFHIQD